MPEYSVVGKPLPRIDAVGKVTGRTVYAADIQLPRMLQAKVRRSPHAHARIVSIDTARARALPGVAAVITAADLPVAQRPATSRRQDVLAAKEVLFVGHAVAVALAEDPHLAEEALELIDVVYQELPAVIDPLEAMKEDAPPVRQPMAEVDRSEERGHITLTAEEQEVRDKPTNINAQIRFTRGDVEQGFAEADLVVEHTWKSSMVHQGYIEPQVTVADYDAASGELTLWTSTQGPFQVRDALAQALGLANTKVRVVGTEVGGGFGGKIFMDQLLVASLAMALGRPVKYVRSRREDLTAAAPADQAIIDLKVGMKRDGTLTAIQGRAIYDSGAFPGAHMLTGCIQLGGLYRVPHLELQGYEVLTNKVSVGALRAPGTHNAAFAIESHVDMMARSLGLDPLEVRLKNCVQEGDPLPTGRSYPRIGLRETLLAVQEHPLWRERQQRKAGRKNRGVGVAMGGWLGGLQPAAASVILNGDGTVNVVTGAADITGVNTSFAQIAAEELGLPLSQINVTTGDTKTAPFAGMSAGSKTTFTVGRAVRAAAEDARRQILEIASRRLEAAPEDLECRDGWVRVKGLPERAVSLEQIASLSTSFGAAYPPVVGRGSVAPTRQAPSFTVQIAEVEVDTDTGQVTLLNFVVAQDVGLAINPMSVAGQMQGGSSQGIGIALMEELIYDQQGRLLNPSLLDYRMPTALDLPPLETIIIEVPSEDGPYGARGVGEPSIVAGAAAIANAVYDAIGVRVDRIPITPERMLRALGRIKD